MAKIGDIIKRKQPEVYRKLMEMFPKSTTKDPERDFREIKKLMRHDSYRRDRGGIRQVRYDE